MSGLGSRRGPHRHHRQQRPRRGRGGALCAAPRRARARRPATFLPMGGKRGVTMLALRHLHTVPRRRRSTSCRCRRVLPSARLDVDTEGCTLCLSCVSACPTGALLDNPDWPMLALRRGRVRAVRPVQGDLPGESHRPQAAPQLHPDAARSPALLSSRKTPHSIASAAASRSARAAPSTARGREAGRQALDVPGRRCRGAHPHVRRLPPCDAGRTRHRPLRRARPPGDPHHRGLPPGARARRPRRRPAARQAPILTLVKEGVLGLAARKKGARQPHLPCLYNWPSWTAPAT